MYNFAIKNTLKYLLDNTKTVKQYINYRALFPYCVQSLDSSKGVYVVLNRDYKPIGIETSDYVDYGGYPHAHIGIDQMQLFACYKADGEGSFYLYNDGCTPAHGIKYLNEYKQRCRKMFNMAPLDYTDLIHSAKLAEMEREIPFFSNSQLERYSFRDDPELEKAAKDERFNINGILQECHKLSLKREEEQRSPKFLSR